VNKDNDTVLVRALLPSGGALKPGQFISLRIVTAVHTNCLAAPVESVVMNEDGKSFIALVNGDDAKLIPIKIGLHENGLVEIAAPELKAGDLVVTVGAYGLPDKTKIHVQNSTGDDTSSTNSPSNSTNSPADK
jgi:multidrug efflux pump subunit AcrA (membrane-fusion protein)